MATIEQLHEAIRDADAAGQVEMRLWEDLIEDPETRDEAHALWRFRFPDVEPMPPRRRHLTAV